MHAHAKPRITLARLVGVASIGGSVFFGLQARDYKEKADSLYEEYERATSSSRAEDLYDDVTHNDFKSGANLVVSVCLAVNGLRLLFSSSDPELKDICGEAEATQRRELAIRIEGNPTKQQVTMVLAKPF
jgi:hypothetical protein